MQSETTFASGSTLKEQTGDSVSDLSISTLILSEVFILVGFSLHNS